ncbi:creatininase family protein [Lysinibacillus mangiferihumi]|uniref:Creatininase family protein n=1 Tax=Lysinibacillus mangiferihumi TaxID=1130819 RepID=A0A4U2YK61_9BACI|nr:creatininase family protein [Lysinibacillus mangiferihumi]TKI60061.1 creatininase family protein [Lysinibacillus mangiferihumi]
MINNKSLLNIPWVDLNSNQPDFMIIATGSIEQHGPHLPLGADFFVANRIAQEITKRYSAVQLPFTSVGVNFMFEDWPGTISISAETYTNLIIEIGEKARRICQRILIINGHDENQPSLITASQRLVKEYGMEVVVLEWAEFVLDILRNICESKYEMHAGEGLTSIFLHWFPEMVIKENIEKGASVIGGIISDDIHLDHRAYNPQIISKNNGSTGVFGDPTIANEDKGSKIAEALIKRVNELIEELNWGTAK